MKTIPDDMNFRCLICNKEIKLEPAVQRTLSSPPLDAVAFTTYGNWGSTVYDLEPMTGAVICDFCFTERADRMITTVSCGNQESYVYVSEIVKKQSWKVRLKKWLMQIFPPIVRRYWQ